ncbi:hypothetical protein SMQE13_30470 [Serratia marcescens]|nr:hypothetical protein SMQE13_30470 [Serratia marcescens]
MKNIVENQDIKTDKPLPMSYEALKAERDALAVENQALKSAITGKAYIDFVTSNGWNTGMKTINGKFAGFMDAEIDFGCMAYDHAKKLIDAVETPATSAALAAIEARSITAALDSCSEYLDTDCVMDRLGISYGDAELRSIGATELCNALKSHAANIREAK